jgi:hypothetical protein
MGVAEDLAREAQAEKLVDPDAPWRQQPASEKQIAALVRCRVKLRTGLTKGEASDLLARVLVGSR